MTDQAQYYYEFTIDFLQSLELQVQTVPLPFSCLALSDLGLRQTLLKEPEEAAATWPSLLEGIAGANHMVILRDIYQCCYILLPGIGNCAAGSAPVVEERAPVEAVSTDEENDLARSVSADVLLTAPGSVQREDSLYKDGMDQSVSVQSDHAFSSFIMSGVTEEMIAAGPFLTRTPELTEISVMCTRLGIPSGHLHFLQQYYSALPLIRDYSVLESYFSTLGKHLYGAGRFEVNDFSAAESGTMGDGFVGDGFMGKGVMKKAVMGKGASGSGGTLPHLSYQPASHTPDSELYHNIEARYQKENEGMQAISRGDDRSAARIFLGDTFRHLTARTSNFLRNQKNFAIIGNTLYRKAAESGGVHPIYLDALSSKFAVRIENAASPVELETVEHEMIRQYCLLVQTRSTAGYSPLIRKVINYIAINFAEDISLQQIADEMAVNKSYLSSLFKKETGQTLTDYINQHRIDHAITLLNLQTGSIQEIAEACGIPDLTYFGRLFRRYKKMTPTEYKKMLQT